MKKTPVRASLPLILASAAVLGSCGGSGPAYRHVVLISLDTFRADHLGCYGNPRVATPEVDALAAESILFRSATSAAATTLASHTSIMTGLYTTRHGVPRNGFMVNPANVMLAEVLSESGFHSAAFLGSFALDRVFDFNQGFAHFDAEFDIEFELGNTDQDQRRAASVTDAVLRHVDDLGESAGRLFLFAHYFDPHAPYDPPAPFAEAYVREGGPTTSDMADVGVQVTKHQTRLIPGQLRPFDQGLHPDLVHGATGEPLPGDEDLAALYAGEVSYLDHHLGRLLDGLAERGVLDDAIVVVIGDHGETFWEHGDFWHHGAWVYETNVQVPLILRLPDGRGRGRVVEHPVSTVDLFPTLLELLEIPLPEAVDGVSLVPALDGEAMAPRPLFSEATQPLRAEAEGRWRNMGKPKCVRYGKWKYVSAPYLRLEQLFDLEADPGERVDRIRQPTEESRKALAFLRQSLQSWAGRPNPRPSRFNEEQVEEVKRRLEGLGYGGKENGSAAPPPESGGR